jgi:hypothetical protein
MAPVAGYIAQVTFQFQSGLPRDVSENVFHFAEFGSGAADLAGAQQVCQRLADFYSGTEDTVDGATVANYFSNEIETLVKIKVYDLAAATPRPILYQDSFTIAPASDLTNLPPEVALCVSYFSTVNVKRQRGRIYLGPLSAFAVGTGPYSAPVAAFVDTIVAAAKRLAVNTGDVAQLSTTLLPGSPATGPVKVVWCVLSHLGTGTPAAPAPELYVIDNGWVDNEWDGQSRRRIAATARTTWAPA